MATAACIISLIPYSRAYAAAADSFSVTDSIRSYYYYNAIAFCIGGQGHGNHTIQTNTTVGDLVPVGNNVYISSIVGGTQHSVRACKDNNTYTEAAALWGWPSDPAGFYQKLGYKWDGTQVVWEKGKATTFFSYAYAAPSVDEVKAAIRDSVYGGKEPRLSSYEWYSVLYDEYLQSCGAAESTRVDLATAPPATITKYTTWSPDDANAYSSIYVKDGKHYGYDTKMQNNEYPNMNAIGMGDQDITNYAGTTVPTCGEVANDLNETLANAAAIKEKELQAAGKDTAIRNPTGDTSASQGKSSCAITGLGWIICPVVNFMASLNDGMYSIISSFLAFNGEGKLLVIPTNTAAKPTTDTAVYNVWSKFRDYANVVFVIIFIIIILSQVSSIGVSNYGIKRLLPKLLIAAVSVNLSFFICVALVEVSNVLGYGLQSLLEGIGSSVGSTFNRTWSETAASALDGTLFGVAGVAAALAVISTQGAIGALALLFPIIIAAVIALFVILLILYARQALLIILITLSPLAFVAYLLPNTEQWFKKWWKLFSTLLMLFPIVAFVFYGSKLAATIIASLGGGWVIAALGIQCIPLLVVPSMLKGSLSAAGSLGTKLQGLGNSATGRLKAKAQDQYKKSNYYQAKQWRKSGEDQYRRSRAATSISDTGGRLGGIKRLVFQGGGHLPLAQEHNAGVDRMATVAQAQVAKDLKENLEGASITISEAALTLPQIRNLSVATATVTESGVGGRTVSGGGDHSATRQAAIQQIVAANDVQGIRDLYQTSHSMDDETRRVFADALQSSSSRPAWASAGSISGIRQGDQQDVGQLVRSAIQGGAYSTQKLATADRDEVAMVADAINDHNSGNQQLHLDQATVDDLVRDAQQAVNDPRFGASKNRSNLNNVIAGNRGVYS